MKNLETLSAPLSEGELLELETFLLAEASSHGAMTLDALDGFLAALVVAPAKVMAGEWLPLVFGLPEEDYAIKAASDPVQRITPLLLRYMSSLVSLFQREQDAFLPLFDRCTYACREDKEAAITSWALAFMFGMELRYEEWEPIFTALDADGDEAALLLGPILLLAGQQDDVREISSAERDQLKKLVAESVSEIYRFWLWHENKPQ